MKKPKPTYHPPVNVKAFMTYLSPEQSAKVARLAKHEGDTATKQFGVEIKISMANMIRKMVDAYPERGITPAPQPKPAQPVAAPNPRRPRAPKAAS